MQPPPQEKHLLVNATETRNGDITSDTKNVVKLVELAAITETSGNLFIPSRFSKIHGTTVMVEPSAERSKDPEAKMAMLIQQTELGTCIAGMNVLNCGSHRLMFFLQIFILAALASMDKNVTREYKVIAEVMPALLTLETPIERFLRMEDNQPGRAAFRLAMYWKHRKLLFGDRWLLPLTQSGRGALSGVEVLLFRRGFFLYIPSQHMPVLVIDYSKTEGLQVTSQVVERLAMYIATAISNDPLTQTKGVAVTHFLMASHQGGSRRNNAKSIFLPELWNWIHKAWPIKLSGFKVVQAHDPYRTAHLLDFLRFRVTKTVAYNCSGVAPEEIWGNSTVEVAQRLQRAGFTRDTLPVQFGGNLNIQEATLKFIRMRTSIEDVMGSSSPYSQPHEIIAFAGCKRKRITHDSKDSKNEHEAERRNLYCRRYYHRQKVRVCNLKDQVQSLQSKVKSARAESIRLSRLLSEANHLLRIIYAQATPTIYTSSIALTSEHRYSLGIGTHGYQENFETPPLFLDDADFNEQSE